MSSEIGSAGEGLDEPVLDRVALAVEQARKTGQTRWVALVVDARGDAQAEDALACYARAGERDRFLFASGESSDFSVSWGVVDEIESAGPDRFRDVRAWAEGVRSRIEWIGDARPATAPTFFGGFGFEAESRGSAEWKAFPAARFVLPEVIIESRDGSASGVCIARIEPGSSAASVASELLSRRAELEPPARRKGDRETTPAKTPARASLSPSDWPAGPEFRVRADRAHEIFCGQVASALEAFEEGPLSKVVLARSLSVDHDADLDVVAFLGRLRSLYPTCSLIAMGRGGDTFLAATPETLIRVRGREVETAALAGSAPRGRHPQEDRVLAERLMSSAKELSEHAYVVDAIRGVLEETCESVEIPERPVLRALFGIQHLETPIRGRLKSVHARHPANGGEESIDALSLVEALHPTPAVGGFPRAAAEDWLHRMEGLDRGWYAAPIGWLDVEGGGDFRVALRSGLIRNGLGQPGRSGASRALLFAGAGIVEGSVPQDELIETRIKLRALLAPLTEI